MSGNGCFSVFSVFWFCAGMTSSSGKRIKTLGTKDKGTKRKEKEQFYSNKFRTPAHERYFQVVEGRRLLMERKVANISSLAPQFERELNNRDWGHLTTYPSPANVDIIKEVYTNAKALGGEDETLGGEQCQFATSMLEGVNYEDVERTLCVLEGHFQRNRSKAPIHITRPHLTPLAKYWMTFSHANIQPCSHVSDITAQRSIFLYYVLRGLNINVGQVIADEIQSCARGATNKTPLGHPSVITHLCEAAGIDVSRPPLERPRKELDATYFTHYYAVDELGQPAPPPQQPMTHRRAPPPAQEPIHDVVPFQMQEMYYSLLDSRLADVYKGEQALLRTLMFAFPKRQFMSQDDFAAYVAWPADPAQEGGRAEATEASSMNEDAKDEDED
ncbi:hypothetical protein LR48_Vigan08g043900 [Vigna angularis]|uniref:Putative plant transposon protein domain-containing protein n=1 Tax=Phaseolus angularis TaxID=3914 RepID=A0A0L9V3W3_PHAAN|nr:hypothetical protein LR48_Vigan08g043900 [Vigna angularis]